MSLLVQERPLILAQRTLQCVLAPPKYRSWEWIVENVHNHKGAPFNSIDFPWVEGICEAWDDPAVRRIFFMAGSRLGKTETFLALMMCSQYHDPDVGMIGGSTESLVVRTIGDRLYKMMEKSHVMREFCPPPHRRNRRICRTKLFNIYGAWSGSPTTLGDLDPKYLQALELDKFTKNSSEEADPAELLFERGAEIPDRKLAAESTPTIKGQSRIDRYVELGTNRRYCVPCPKCKAHHPLDRNRTGNQQDGGLWWDREKDGSTTASTAAKTCRYVCPSCHKEWGDEYRRPAVRQGVWVAPGQSVDKRGRVKGTPINDGPDESFRLSRLYGATFSFDAYARAFVQSQGEPEKERSFVNNWDGETWVPIKVQMNWNELAERLCIGTWEMGVVPANCNFVTTAIDVQIDHFVCTAFAWDHLQRAHLIAYGIAHSWNNVRDWCYAAYPHEDGGQPVPSFVNLIDSRDGNRKDEIFDFCMTTNKTSGPFVWPSMGARPGSMNLQLFKKMRIDHEHAIGKKATGRVIEGMHLVMVNTTYTQEWIDNAMVRREPGSEKSIVLPGVMVDDKDFFDQLLNEVFDAEKGTWLRVDETTIPVDFRDCVRYARAAAEVYCNGNWARVPSKRPVISQTREERESRQRQVAQSKASPSNSNGGGFIRKPQGNAFLRSRK